MLEQNASLKGCNWLSYRGPENQLFISSLPLSLLSAFFSGFLPFWHVICGRSRIMTKCPLDEWMCLDVLFSSGGVEYRHRSLSVPSVTLLLVPQCTGNLLQNSDSSHRRPITGLCVSLYVPLCRCISALYLKRSVLICLIPKSCWIFPLWLPIFCLTAFAEWLAADARGRVPGVWNCSFYECVVERAQRCRLGLLTYILT